MVYTQMLFALAFDKLIWGTTPGALSIVGSSLILGSAIYVAMRKEHELKDGEGRGMGSAEEERVLMSPMIVGEPGEEGDTEVQLRVLRV